jgi:glycosyltransferase involved in cell wall biosynthesis
MSTAERPKILVLITHLERGGAQETVVGLAGGLRRRGFDVTVGAQLGGPMQERLEADGVPLVHLPHLVRQVSPVDDARAYREVGRLIRDGGFDVVHTHSSKAGVLGRIVASRAKVPVIVHTSHGLPVNPDMSGAERWILLAAERRAARASDRIVAVSHATADELVALRLARPEQISIIPSGIDVDRFRNLPSREEARRSFGISADGPVAGWVGRHFPQKRPEVVLEVARRLVRTMPEASFLMVGDGPSFEEAVASTEDEPRIHVVGFRNDIETAYAAMDLLVLASAWEGLPRTVLEAGAAGVPVVSTDVSGVSEVVKDGETGRLTPATDSRSLADGVVGLLRNDVERELMGKSIASLVGSEYSDEHMVDASIELYRAAAAVDRAGGSR